MATLTVQKTNTSVDVDDAVKPEVTTRDYSGAQEKTDPKEIALVRKLDLWIMPVLWLMYWLNYLVRASLTRWLALGLTQKTGPQRHCSRPPQHT